MIIILLGGTGLRIHLNAWYSKRIQTNPAWSGPPQLVLKGESSPSNPDKVLRGESSPPNPDKVVRGDAVPPNPEKGGLASKSQEHSHINIVALSSVKRVQISELNLEGSAPVTEETVIDQALSKINGQERVIGCRTAAKIQAAKQGVGFPSVQSAPEGREVKEC